MKRLAVATLVALVALPAAALVPRAEVRTLVEMPLAVTTVADFGVPEPEVERVVWQLNEAEVPVADAVEIVRYTPFPLVVTEYRPVEPLSFEQDVDNDWGVDWELDELDMLLLLQSHLDDGLRGELLGSAVLADLLRLGFDVGSGDTWRAAPRPVEHDFVYYLTPGYRFDTDRGLFRDRVVVVDQDDFGFRRDGDRWLPDRDLYRDREVIARRDDVRDRGEERAGGPPAIPPGHAKHGPDGPHPTPGHVKHAGPD
ncbi:MAG TPA: hypothetical protein VHQ65_02745, partial [Thermoanaerobaculia bacterium]|nr:hypothetical protein [Thermoanaerobaculia bacterium]